MGLRHHPEGLRRGADHFKTATLEEP
jgi:hypothetical protein